MLDKVSITFQHSSIFCFKFALLQVTILKKKKDLKTNPNASGYTKF